MSKRKYYKNSDLLDKIDELFKKMNKKNDTICILLAANFIDKCLANLLVTKLPTKDKNFVIEELLNRNLSNFSTRYKIAYALNIIDKRYFDDIETIGSIRNEFAHIHFEISFKEPEIIKYCGKLKLWEKRFPPYRVKEFNELPYLNDPEICKLKFINTVHQIVHDLVGSGLIHNMVYEVDL